MHKNYPRLGKLFFFLILLLRPFFLHTPISQWTWSEVDWNCGDNSSFFYDFFLVPLQHYPYNAPLREILRQFTAVILCNQLVTLERMRKVIEFGHVRWYVLVSLLSLTHSRWDISDSILNVFSSFTCVCNQWFLGYDCPSQRSAIILWYNSRLILMLNFHHYYYNLWKPAQKESLFVFKLKWSGDESQS